MKYSKFIIILLLHIIYSCQSNEPDLSQQKQSPTKYKAFNVENENYEEKFFTYLNENEEYDENSIYIIFNTGWGSNSCSKETFSNLFTYLSKSNKTIKIFTNDLNLIDSENIVYQRANIFSIMISKNDFEKHQIKHSAPYYYDTKSSEFKGYKITSTLIDSLNQSIY